MGIDLEELERLAAQATPGPWFCKSVPGLGGGRHNRPHIFADGICLPVASLSVIKGEEDAAYITAACNAVPELIARVRELERQKDKLLGMYCNEMVCSWCWLDEVCPHFDETIVRRNPNSEGCRETLRKWLEQAAKEAGNDKSKQVGCTV